MYEDEVQLEKTIVDEELWQAVQKNKELSEENESLMNQQNVCKEQMKLLQEAEDKRKKEKDCFDIFGSLPQEELVWKHGGESKKQKVHVLADEKREAELIKEKFIKEKEAKEK